jgi:hypothetical protein
MHRSAISNRLGRLPGVDGRSERARRFRDLAAGLKRDIGRALNGAEASLVDQAAGLTLTREAMISLVARGERIDSRELVRLSSAISRTLDALGLTQRSERSAASRKSRGDKRNSEAANESATSLDSSEVVSKIVQLFEEATRTGNNTLLARAARVRELLSKAQLRKQ